MGAHLINGQFQSDKYPTCPAGKVPLSVNDETAQDLLWQYAQRRRAVDAEFAADLEAALIAAGFDPATYVRAAAQLSNGEVRVWNPASLQWEAAPESSLITLSVEPGST